MRELLQYLYLNNINSNVFYKTQNSTPILFNNKTYTVIDLELNMVRY